MNIYKLKREEIKKMHDEFNKTDYGKRAKAFSVLPLLAGFIWLVFLIASFYINNIADTEEVVFDMTEIILLSGLATINISIGCITQLQYGRVLKEYIESKK